MSKTTEPRVSLVRLKPRAEAEPRTSLALLKVRPRKPQKNWPRPKLAPSQKALDALAGVELAYDDRATLVAIVQRHITERRHAEDPERGARLRAHLANQPATDVVAELEIETMTMKTTDSGPKTSLAKLKLKAPDAPVTDASGEKHEAAGLIKGLHAKGGVALHLPQALRKGSKK